MLAKLFKPFSSVFAPTKSSQRVKYFEYRIDSLKKGELVVIATRSKILRGEFLLCLANCAITQNQLVAIYSVSESSVQFTHKLATVMADIPADTNIYAGDMNDAEVSKLTSALAAINASKILMYPFSMIQHEQLCDTAKKLQRQTGEIGLILIDTVQIFFDKKRRYIGAQQSLIRLKALAEELKIPVVALYQLDSTIENHSSTLTRYELSEVEALSELTDGFMLMSGTHDDLEFARPKVPNAKSVEWLN